MKKLAIFSSALLAGTVAMSTAAVAEELTPMGAIKGANADGSIPEWTGGLTDDKAPEFSADKGFTDPYADDAVKFKIDSSNYKEYADKLSAGHEKLFESYPSYFMNVYPTQRSAAFPQAVYDAALANEGTAKLEGDQLTGAKLAVPFRKPTTGEQVLTNHKTRYRGDTVTRFNNQVIVNPDGNLLRTQSIERVLFNFGNIAAPNASDDENLSFYYVSKVLAPPKDAGQVTLVHEFLGPVGGGTSGKTRNAWIYNPGQRRVRKAPNVAYDYKPLGTDGQQFADQVDMFNGATDRYTWKLEGRKEFYVPYNAYKLADKSLTYDQILTGKHLKQDLARYELHRVWVVDSNLKEGSDHAIGGRTFYVDEDTWGIVMVDIRDKRGDLWRFQEGHTIQYYGQKVMMGASTTPEIIYDFANGKYFATALTNEDKVNSFDNPDFKKKMFQNNYMKKIK